MIGLLIESIEIVLAIAMVFVPPCVAFISFLHNVIDAAYGTPLKTKIIDGVLSCINGWIWVVFFVATLFGAITNVLLSQFVLTMTILSILNVIGFGRLEKWCILFKEKREKKVINELHMNEVKHKTRLEKEQRR